MAKSKNEKQYIQDLPIADKIQAKYELSKEDILTEEGLFLVQCLVRDGASMDSIAKTFGIAPQTFYLWRQKYPELQDACKRGKQLVDYEVENALLKAALGYKTETVRTYINNSVDGAKNREVKIDKTTTEVGPNVTACLAWLNNRKPEQWKRNRDNDMLLKDKAAGITINITKGVVDVEDTIDEDDE